MTVLIWIYLTGYSWGASTLPCPADPIRVASELVEQELEGKSLAKSATSCLDPKNFAYTQPAQEERKEADKYYELDDEDAFVVKGVKPLAEKDAFEAEFVIKLRTHVGGVISHTRVLDSIQFKMTAKPGHCAIQTKPPKNLYVKRKCKPTI